MKCRFFASGVWPSHSASKDEGWAAICYWLPVNVRSQWLKQWAELLWRSTPRMKEPRRGMNVSVHCGC